MEDLNISLSGHSGCTIKLMKNESDEVIVRKCSGSLDYNERLVAQCERQNAFKNHKIKAPKILGKGYTDAGMFYFDMEYVRGITLAEYMKIIEASNIKGIVKDIVDVLISESIAGSDDDNLNINKVFGNKIADLNEKLLHIKDNYLRRAFTILAEKDWTSFNFSLCHGDLTLENIIVHNEEMYLIDFLDSFYECWMFDAATLMQDVQCMWSYRDDKLINNNTKIRLLIFKDLLFEEIAKHKDTSQDIYFALLLKLIRILPYTNDDKTVTFLKENIVEVMDIIESIEVNSK